MIPTLTFNRHKTVVAGKTQFISAISAEAEQSRYQQDVFRSILKVVILVCSLLGVAYLFPAIQQQSLPALFISLMMLILSGYSALSIAIMDEHNLHMFVRFWLTLSTWTVFSFGFLQQDDFINIMALGATVVIVLAIFLEPVRNAYQWAAGNIAAYLLVVLSHQMIDIPHFDLGMLHSLVIYGTPIGILIMITEVGRITTQRFKFSLIQSETRRKQLEIQGKQLTVYATEVNAAREKAERSDRVKSTFLASMSHELRTPLNAIINFTRFVLDGDTGEINEEQKEFLTDVVKSGEHLLHLINDVLDMSKIEAGSLNLFIEDDIDVENIVNTVLSTGRGLLKEKQVRLQSIIEPDLPLIRCDHQRILQVLLNLLSNACKFTEAGAITIRARQSGDHVVFSVTDTGPGIAEADHELVFQAFKQSQTGLRHGSGTGLGLAISKSLAQAHGGDMWLESEAGKGATFFVSLPIKSDSLIPVLM